MEKGQDKRWEIGRDENKNKRRKVTFEKGILAEKSQTL